MAYGRTFEIIVLEQLAYLAPDITAVAEIVRGKVPASEIHVHKRRYLTAGHFVGRRRDGCEGKGIGVAATLRGDRPESHRYAHLCRGKELFGKVSVRIEYLDFARQGVAFLHRLGAEYGKGSVFEREYCVRIHPEHGGQFFYETAVLKGIPQHLVVRSKAHKLPGLVVNAEIGDAHELSRTAAHPSYGLGKATVGIVLDKTVRQHDELAVICENLSGTAVYDRLGGKPDNLDIRDVVREVRHLPARRKVERAGRGVEAGIRLVPAAAGRK